MYFDYSGTEIEPLLRRDMSRVSSFQERFGAGTAMLKFDPDQYPFRDAMTEMLVDKGFLSEPVALERLHEILSLEDMTMDTSGQAPIAVAGYEPSARMRDIYKAFLAEAVWPVFGEPFYYQDALTFRFSFPGSPGFSWRPNYHTDIAIGHPPQEINVWITLTGVQPGNSLVYAELEDSQSMWSRYDLNFQRFHADLDEKDELQDECAGITKSLDCAVGDAFLFDSRCMHVHQRNTADKTRVSLDFRILLTSDYASIPELYRGSGRRKMLFAPGHYYAAEACAPGAGAKRRSFGA